MNAIGMLEIMPESENKLVTALPDNRETIVAESTVSPSAPVNGTGRPMNVDAETSSISPKSPTSSTTRSDQGARVFPSDSKAEQLRRFSIDVKETASTEGIAQQSESFEAMLSLIQSKAKQSPPSTASRPQTHKLESVDSAHMLDDNLHSASTVARRRTLEHSEGVRENGAAESASSVAYPLLPGATALTGGQFLSARLIFELLSQPQVRAQAVSAIPTGPKVNCYFVVNIGAELTDYQKYFENRQKISDKLRESTFQLVNSSNHCFTVSRSGVLKYVDLKKNNIAPFDLRMHCATFRNVQHVDGDGDHPAERRICWFFNAQLSPAPGFIVIMYHGVSHQHTCIALKPSTQSTKRDVQEKAPSCSKAEAEVNDDESDESQPVTKRRR